GQKAEGKSRPGLFFPENNMRVQDVEVLNLAVTDKTVSDLIASFQTKSVQDSLTLTAKQQELEITTHITAINSRLQQLAADANIKKVELERIEAEANHAHSLALSNEKFLLAKAQRDSALVIEKAISLESQEKLTRRIAQDNQDLTLANAQTKLFVERMGSVNDKLANAIEDLSQSGMLATLSSAIAPIAVMEHQGIGPSIKRLLAGTPLQDKVEPMLSGVGGNGGHRTDSDE
ncbi:MAG: hypothetical protein K2Z81_15460, partial [Cyanobacteria bacterium]|nr:hypothetical protein [Cyanobacteriota bacterium]